MIGPGGEGLLKHPRQAVPWEACRQQVPELMVTECVSRCQEHAAGPAGSQQALPGAPTPLAGRVRGELRPNRGGAAVGSLWGSWCSSASPRGPGAPQHPFGELVPLGSPPRAVRHPPSRGGRSPGRGARPQLRRRESAWTGAHGGHGELKMPSLQSKDPHSFFRTICLVINSWKKQPMILKHPQCLSLIHFHKSE